jgi:hypothetical protein
VVWIATPDSCPWCLGQETAPIDLVVDFENSDHNIEIAVCVECASPLAFDPANTNTRRITETSARKILSDDDWTKFQDTQAMIRNLTPEGRKILRDKLREP